MAWPPALPSVGFKSEGYTTIVWGTDFASTDSFSGYIVVSVRPAQRVENPIIENGSGLTATSILLIDGYNYEITVVDDTAVSAPASGSVVSVTVPDNASAVTMWVIDNSYAAARKQPGERTLLCRSYTLFTVV